MINSIEHRANRTPRVQVRKGRVFWEPSASLRKAGYKSQALGPLHPDALNQADELNDAADLFLAGEQARRPAAGTLAQAIEKYKVSTDFTEGLGIRTQRDSARHLERAKSVMGSDRLDQITTHKIKAWHKDLAKKSQSDARNSLAALRAALTWAVDEELIGSNPALGTKAAPQNKRKRVATRDELWAMIQTADRMGLPSVAAVALTAVATMQRVNDTLSLTRRQIKDGVLFLTQSKTGVELSFRLHPLVVDRLGPLPDQDVALFPNEHTRRAYQIRAFERAWSKVRDTAAENMPSLLGQDPDVCEPVLKGKLNAGDLRRSGMVWAAEAGTGINQICSVSGHTLQKGYEILETYMPRQRIFADQAIGRLDLIRSPAIEEIERHLLAS